MTGENGFLASLPKSAARQTPPQLKSQRSGPLVVNGSTTFHDKQVEATGDGPEQSNGINFSASTSEDLAFDTPTSSEDRSQGLPETIDSELPLLSAHSHPEPIDDSLQHGTMNPIDARYGVAEGSIDGGPSTVQMPLRPSNKAAATVKTDQKLLPNGVGGQPFQGQLPTQLSPVREVPLSLPNSDNHAGKLPQDVSNRGGKPKGKGRQDKAPLPGAENQRRKEDAPNPAVLGTTPSAAEKEIPNGTPTITGWQTQKKKKHRKASKSEGDINTSNAVGGDFLPNEDNLRKGG